MSARQFHQNNFADLVQSAIKDANINPKQLKLELTESILLDDFDTTIATMNLLKEIGVLFSLDDFGTGYSSLHTLNACPCASLKLTKPLCAIFLPIVATKPIVTTIIAMAKSLDLEVIAEGVETEEQKQQLFELGCLAYQGFLFGKPVPITPFEALNQSAHKQQASKISWYNAASIL